MSLLKGKSKTSQNKVTSQDSYTTSNKVTKKSMLAPCRRVGLGRKRALHSPTINESSNKDDNLTEKVSVNTSINKELSVNISISFKNDKDQPQDERQIKRSRIVHSEDENSHTEDEEVKTKKNKRMPTPVKHPSDNMKSSSQDSGNELCLTTPKETSSFQEKFIKSLQDSLGNNAKPETEPIKNSQPEIEEFPFEMETFQEIEIVSVQEIEVETTENTSVEQSDIEDNHETDDAKSEEPGKELSNTKEETSHKKLPGKKLKNLNKKNSKTVVPEPSTSKTQLFEDFKKAKSLGKITFPRSSRKRRDSVAVNSPFKPVTETQNKAWSAMLKNKRKMNKDTDKLKKFASYQQPGTSKMSDDSPSSKRTKNSDPKKSVNNENKNILKKIKEYESRYKENEEKLRYLKDLKIRKKMHSPETLHKATREIKKTNIKMLVTLMSLLKKHARTSKIDMGIVLNNMNIPHKKVGYDKDQDMFV